jgi:hypothetical protein
VVGRDVLAAAAALLVAVGSWVATPAPALAGPIERACMASGRDAANRGICGCIQQVADQTLDSSDQRRAARFFSDPELAHKTWISDSARDDAFWDRWENFGATAEVYCTAP